MGKLHKKPPRRYRLSSQEFRRFLQLADESDQVARIRLINHLWPDQQEEIADLYERWQLDTKNVDCHGRVLI